MDLVYAIVRGFEIGLSIVAALAVLLVVNFIIIFAQNVIEVFTGRAERKEDEDTEQHQDRRR